jgi:lysyl-tRNA synthetase class 2
LIFKNQYELQRIEKLKKLQELGFNPYENRSKRDCKINIFLDSNKDVETLENKRDNSRKYTISGRIKFLRLMGKAMFLKIEDETGLLQIYIARDNLKDGFYNEIKKIMEVGDFIDASGYPFVTNKGELSLLIEDLQILTKSISPLPEKFHGLQDIELKYRQRYLDLIMDKNTRDRFVLRSKIVSIIRSFFEGKGFLEVETPMLHPIAGGASARPFITKHNTLGVNRFLRIAPELYLKRLIVGGFEAIFELNRNFRNEGMDHTHNPEFTMLEFYWAYKQYEDLIELTKELFIELLHKLDLPKKLTYGENIVDFGDIKICKYLDSIVKIGGVDKDIVHNKDKILELLKSRGKDIDKKTALGVLQAELFDEFVENKLINPTFVTHFPIDISPLARANDNDPTLADRFELFIGGSEISNGFSELNDAQEQYKRFQKQIDDKVSDDDEYHCMDEDYVKALGYGMPPTAGQGIGIDRLVMVLTNQTSIRDVLLFPSMKPIAKENR